MPTYLPGRLSRPIVLLVALAMAFSLLAVTPVTTKAQTSDPAPDYLASFDACPEDEDVIPDAGFVDVPNRHANAGDINCIAYYGITRGKTTTTYAPDAPVIREHMALFLIRLAEKVDIYVPAAGSTPFTDISKLSRESRDAISQLYKLGITKGATATTYAPSRNVTRGEMALFLQRLMDLMEVVADGRSLYGYTPQDVDDRDFDVEAPWRDLRDSSRDVNEAVAALYELGVASGFGGSTRTYGPERDMSRADMAAFMAAILDHSNLRPKGINAQVAPTRGPDNYDITAMISVRSDTFAPQEDQPVDWFYTDDSEGGLERNGECATSTILKGNCEWETNDEETDRDGNIFVEFRATAGETMTFYAWIGRRNGDEFDEDNANYSKAEAVSVKGASNLSVTHDVPIHAWQTSRGDALIVDMDRQSSVEFTIQLQDDLGANLEREGVVIDIEVDSQEIQVDATALSGGNPSSPDPYYQTIGRSSRDDSTVVTDRRGEATFELEGPSRDERLDEVTIETDCCTERINIAWSDGDPVLVTAKPAFDPYQFASSNRVRFTVEYNLYDQYGNDVRGHTTRYTGRSQDLDVSLKHTLYEAVIKPTDQTNPFDYDLTPQNPHTENPTSSNWNRGRFRLNLEGTETLATGKHYLLLLKPVFCSAGSAGDNCIADPRPTGTIDYAESEVIVWIVTNASSATSFTNLKNGRFALTGATDLPSLSEVELYSTDRKFRTFFTLWSYDSNDRFRGDDDYISMERFEALWERQVNGIEDINVLIYGSALSIFAIE